MTSLKARVDAKPYSKGPSFAGIDLWLDANEGAPILTDAEIGAAAARACVRRYPDASALERDIAERLGVSPARVVVTAGGDEAIDRVCRGFVGAGDEAVMATPTFEMIGRYVRAAGGVVRGVRWDGPEYPVGAVVGEVTDRTALVAAVSPNNPTGGVVRAGDVVALSHAAPRAVLLVDLAYTEFADEDLTPLALELPNAVIVRTFSKAYGLAGLRVGYAVASEEIAGVLRAAAGPYAVSAASVEVARAALEIGSTRLAGNVARVREERRELRELLTARGAQVMASQGNFVLARGVDAERVWSELGRAGIAVRKFASDELRGCLRIGCPGDERSFARVKREIARIMECGA
jgi:histidinol-phosphate aminotransferase